MVAIDPSADPEPAPSAKVVKRFVLRGPGMTGDRYRITVADPSGLVIGARVPSEREVRFAEWQWPDIDEIGIGPVAFSERGVHEMLIRWGGTPCGPVVTVDVASDLLSIRVIDRTPGCDASGNLYWPVLRFRGSPPDPEDIKGSRVRHR